MDFIGVGAQKSGTSWIYACLYEHPEICAPIKEIHFFSRKRNWSKGIDWYRGKFNTCKTGSLRGEFSTSYLYDENSAARIKKHFPKAKIIVSLRNPVNRAFSQYRNAIKAGEISKDTSIEDALKQDKSIIEQGMYYEQVKRYIDMFGKDQVLVLVYEDSKKDPAKFVKSIYTFLDIDENFVPSMLHRSINTARTPHYVVVDRYMTRIAEFLRKNDLDKIVWFIKKSSIPDMIRKVNTQEDDIILALDIKQKLKEIFKEDEKKLSKLLKRDLVIEWKELR